MTYRSFRLMNKPNYSYGDTGLFEALAGFVNHRDHNGLYIAKISMEDSAFLRSYMRFLMGKLGVKNESFMEKYHGSLLSDVSYDDLNEHSKKSDGAIVVDRRGYIVDDHRVGRFMMPEMVSPEARTGTGHVSMALLSRFPGVTTYVCSAERKTVKKFRGGELEKYHAGTQEADSGVVA